MWACMLERIRKLLEMLMRVLLMRLSRGDVYSNGDIDV